MNYVVIAWNHSITIPYRENVHDVCHAFLRTSDQGDWLPDEQQASDPFVLHYRRGEWKRAFFSRGLKPASLVPDDPAAAPMEVQIKIRPAPSEIKIGIRHKLFWNDYERHSKASQEEGERIFDRRVTDEVKAFAAYLRQMYQLPEMPKLTDL